MNSNKVALVILCLGLTVAGFEYDSGWAFVGAVISFLSAVD